MIDINEYRKRKNKEKIIDDDDEDFFEMLRELYADDGTMLYALDPEKFECFKRYCEIVCEIIDGSKVKMECGIRKTCPDEGYIKIIGESVVVSNPELWCEVVKQATCLEVYPKTDGNVQVDLTFYGLTLDND